jgi:hypothetical protein
MEKYPLELLKFSSFGYYAFGQSDFMITPPDCYLILGKNDKERQNKYREMVDLIIKVDFAKAINWEEFAIVSNPFWVCERFVEITKTYSQLQ